LYVPITALSTLSLHDALPICGCRVPALVYALLRRIHHGVVPDQLRCDAPGPDLDDGPLGHQPDDQRDRGAGVRLLHHADGGGPAADHRAPRRRLKEDPGMLRHCTWLAGNEPRPAGSPAAAAAEEAVFAAMERLGLDPAFQPVSFLGWRAGTVRLTAAGREIPARAMAWSAPVQAAGRLRYAGIRRLIGVFDWPCFELVDDEGRVLAEVYGRDRGPAVPLAKLTPVYPLPGVIIGAGDMERLLAAAGVEPGGTGEGRLLPAELELDATFLPGARLRNVIGTWGSGPAEILVAAHHDTMFDSPGANDNGSGVEAMLRVAERVTAAPERYGRVRWRFCSFGGEELVQVGSEFYAAGREADGSLADIRLVINLDSVG